MSLSAAEIQSIMDASPMIHFLGMTIDELDVAAGRAVFALPMRPEFERAPGTGQFHGGAIAMFIDTAGDFAVAANVGGAVPTMNLRVDFMRPCFGDALRAEAIVRRLGRTVAVVDIDVFDRENRLCAVGRGSYGTNPG